MVAYSKLLILFAAAAFASPIANPDTDESALAEVDYDATAESYVPDLAARDGTSAEDELNTFMERDSKEKKPNHKGKSSKHSGKTKKHHSTSGKAAKAASADKLATPEKHTTSDKVYKVHPKVMPGFGEKRAPATTCGITTWPKANGAGVEAYYDQFSLKAGGSQHASANQCKQLYCGKGMTIGICAGSKDVTVPNNWITDFLDDGTFRCGGMCKSGDAQKCQDIPMDAFQMFGDGWNLLAKGLEPGKSC